MTANKLPSTNRRASRRSARLRWTGSIVLLAGLAWAWIIYWNRPPDRSDDLSMVGYDRATRRQMGQLYGKMGMLIQDWSNELKKPATQAALIGGVSVAIAAALFYLARLSDDDTPVA